MKLFSYIFLTSTILIAYSLISNAFWYPLFEKQLSSPEKWLGNTPQKAAYLFLLRTIHLSILMNLHPYPMISQFLNYPGYAI